MRDEDGADQARATLLAQIETDLRLFSRLHDRELTQEEAEALAAEPAASWFGVRLLGDDGAAALALMDRWRAEAGDMGVEVENLAAAFADLYLTYGARAAPSESVWLDEDGLERQEPMFGVRRWYDAHGLEAPDWRRRSDDHIAHQVQFIAAMVARGDDDSLGVAAKFMDRHLLQWLPDFADGAAARSDSAFYAALALITACYADQLRDLLAAFSGQARRDVEFREERARVKALRETEPEPVEPFIPGAAPSW